MANVYKGRKTEWKISLDINNSGNNNKRASLRSAGFFYKVSRKASAGEGTIETDLNSELSLLEKFYNSGSIQNNEIIACQLKQRGLGLRQRIIIKQSP